MIRKLKWVIGSDISHTFPCNYWSKRLSPIFLMRVVLFWIIVYKAKKLCLWTESFGRYISELEKIIVPGFIINAFFVI